VVGRHEVVLDGSRELGEDRPAAFERLDRGQRVPAASFPTIGPTWEPSAGVSMPSSPSRIVAVPVPEKGFFSGTQATLTCVSSRH